MADDRSIVRQDQTAQKFKSGMVLNALSNDPSLWLFMIAAASGTAKTTGPALMDISKITRKQFYSRLSALIRKRDRKYSLASFGRLILGVFLAQGGNSFRAEVEA